MKFSTCFCMLLLIIINVLIFSDSATAPDTRDSQLSKSDVLGSNKLQIKAQDTLVSSELLTQIISSGLLSSKYETNYFMEAIIQFLVKYLSLILNFSAVFGDRNYEHLHNKIRNIVLYLESRSSYSNRNKMLYRNKVNELSEYINYAVNIKLFNSLITDLNHISKETIYNIASNSKNIKNIISQIVVLLEKLLMRGVDSNLKYASKFLSKASNECLRMFNNCIYKYHILSKAQFNSLFESKIEEISKSTLSVQINNDFGYLTDMEANFEKIIKTMEVYYQFLETGSPSLTISEIAEAKQIIADFFENGDLDETGIFKKEEIALISYEFLGLAAMNLSLFDKTGYVSFKNEVEDALKSATSMINHRGTEIRLSQSIVITIREEIRKLMGYQDILRLDFTAMNLDDSLLNNEIINSVVSRFYELLLKAFEFVRKDQSKNNGGKYVKTVFIKLNSLFEMALDYYKIIILDLAKNQKKLTKQSTGIISNGNKKSKSTLLGKKNFKQSYIKYSKVNVASLKRREKVLAIAKRKSLSTSKQSTSIWKRKSLKAQQLKMKSEKQIKAQILSETSQLLRVSDMLRSQLSYLNRINQIEVASIIASVLEILNEILFSDGLLSQDEFRENLITSGDFSSLVLNSRSTQDQTSENISCIESFSDDYNSDNSHYDEKMGNLKHLSRRSSKSDKLVKSSKTKSKAQEKIRPLDQIGPTIELFGENPVFATRRSSISIENSVDICKASPKTKKISETGSKHVRPKSSTSSKFSSNKAPSTSTTKTTKTLSVSKSKKLQSSISTRSKTRRLSQSREYSNINKKLLEEKSLYIVPPKLFGQEVVNNVISKFNVKVLNFSHVSLNSSLEYILRAINFCYSEINQLFFQVFPFLSEMEHMVLKQIIMQMIVIFKNLVSIFIEKDRKRSGLSKKVLK